MNEISPINVPSVSFRKNRVSQPAFRENEQEVDTAEIKNDKKGMSTGAKIGIGLGAAAALAIGGFLVSKNHAYKIVSKKIDKLCTEKIVMSNLPEKIEFKPSDNLEDSIKFAKEVLGIKKVDKNFTPYALNNTLKAIVDVSNLHKGKVFMPTELEFKATDYTTAQVYKNVFKDNFGKMVINPKYFDRNILGDWLKKELYKTNGEATFNKAGYGQYYSTIILNKMVPQFEKTVTPLLDKFYSSPKDLTIDEMRLLWASLKTKDEIVAEPDSCPMSFIKKCKNFMEKNGVKVSLEELSKKTPEEQSRFIKDSFGSIINKGVPTTVEVPMCMPEEIIWHEMGHLQDYGKNLKELYQAAVNNGDKYAVENRFSTICEKENKALWEKDKEEFKKRYPDAYEFLTNKETQEIAGKVSRYAKTGIGEFIADTYKDLVYQEKYGRAVDDDVIALFKKYKGPEFN